MTTPPPYGPYPPPPGPYAGPYGYPGYPPRGTNALAIVSLVCAFLFAPLGIIFGHISLSQIKKTGEDGRGLAIAGLVISYLITVFTVVAIVLSVLFFVTVANELERLDGLSTQPSVTAAPSPVDKQLPPFEPPKTLGANCQYPATTEPASKPVKPPQNGRIATDPALIRATITTTQGAIGLELDNGKTPCTVNNFTSLARQGFFDNTKCHRLTTSAELGVLQCGDPTGSSTGGPGYRFPNEYPTNQYRLTDPALKVPVIYPRGTLAMANSGPGTNGSQFFLVYKDSQLSPTYTVFGTIDAAGLATLEKVAAGGVADGTEDGKPVIDATIKSVQIGS
ncbi:peptidyl-prolyl cis-trans isomerase B (cyclophilin B) [Mycobacterium sp. OAS707]|uniref:peptidylprolyl isomerase n=1 Tax=Mycobacterium sp. OAS707 TaxID=2663822 RepID=UPI00178A8C31|nr:peptidylprolyl isomerase [Mycobacterium sp. OAS707]MBE1546390.1 peptidyl-prolyl cis-trans isomerase B (cyclophilin B) [Mycobacterium sp. OAS707]